jgi:hypothetical protein
LIGSRGIWLFFSIIGAAIFTLLWVENGGNILFLGIVVSLMELIGSIIVGWYYLPSFVKEAADRYAECVWMTFSVITEKNHQT